MKNTKRILALFTALLLALSLTACLVPNETDDSSKKATGSSGEIPAPDGLPTSASESDAPASEFDGEATAIELGDIKIKANDVVNMFDSYMSMFAYSGSVDEELVSQCLSMTEDEAVRYYVPLWKAQELGITIPEEEERAMEADASAQVEEERGALLCQFAYYYGAAEEMIEDASLLTEEQINVATDAINEQLAEMFHSGFVFEDYLRMEHDNILEGLRIDRLNDLLKASLSTDALDSEEADAWYQRTLEAQQAKYDKNPLEYYYDAQDLNLDSDETPILYVPEGYIRVQVIELVPDGEPDAQIEANGVKLKDLEAEYGELALNGKDADRQAEIAAEYAALKAETEALENGYYNDVRAKIDEAYAALQNGASFEDVMKTYNSSADNESGLDERLVYVNGADPRNGSLGEHAKVLRPGTYSEPVLIDGAYVIVKLIEVVKPGRVDRTSIEEDIRIAALAALTEEKWEEQFDEWFTEAKEIAVFHRETYSMVGDYYLSMY